MPAGDRNVAAAGSRPGVVLPGVAFPAVAFPGVWLPLSGVTLAGCWGSPGEALPADCQYPGERERIGVENVTAGDEA
jgi:hypothetical protein